MGTFSTPLLLKTKASITHNESLKALQSL